ncbi:hypothetical protein CMI47_13015 [Candidatus Pacearchaeota archaeon]|nr:hypothetical protein [Candidatus Pacearchaeota archaeon]|tara:strand:- start:540 stop:830 length:291 start_codon:yes stop_codon:yes gene_type:complete
MSYDDSKTIIKRLAIIKNVSYGLRIKGNIEPRLWFTVWMSEKSCNTLEFTGNKIKSLLKDANILKIEELEGKPCWVFTSGADVTYHSLFNIPIIDN